MKRRFWPFRNKPAAVSNVAAIPDPPEDSYDPLLKLRRPGERRTFYLNVYPLGLNGHTTRKKAETAKGSGGDGRVVRITLERDSESNWQVAKIQ